MTTPWTTSGPASRPGAGDGVTLIDGSTFCISDRNGTIRAEQQQGLFVRDTRVLSGWELLVDGSPAEPLSARVTEPYAATFIGRVARGSGHPDGPLLMLESRYIGDGMRAQIEIRNLTAQPVDCVVELRVAADFADLFEVKQGRGPDDGRVSIATEQDTLELTGLRGGQSRAVRIRADGDPMVRPNIVTWRPRIPPHDAWTACVEIQAAENGRQIPLQQPGGVALEDTLPARRLRAWRERAPVVMTADADLAAVFRRSVEDLGMLRMFDPELPEQPAVAAGAPWFMALFGRDSLLTSWMMLPVDHRLALGTLRMLAAHQGVKVDPMTEEQPGRIPHELRFGPAASPLLGGGTTYYGTADATALFVMLVGEVSRWGIDPQAVTDLLPNVDRALDWISHHGDADGDGFVEYHRGSDAGLVNQGWKDSRDAINFADGRLAESPIALSEVQAYTYAAYGARAHLARIHGDDDTERYWTERAAALKRAFNDTFWLPERGWFAVGLDADKRPIDSLTSNIGHCLWTGIVDDDKAVSVAAHLLSPEMFTGWGIRTLADSMGAYDPVSYHNGSVWPHDNALCAAGLMRYGFVEEAQRVAAGILDAAACFQYRLPELFCGFARDMFEEPVPYPTSCSPQAWASAAPLSLLRTLLRIEPDPATGRPVFDPAVPDRYLPLSVTGVPIGGVDLTIKVTTGDRD